MTKLQSNFAQVRRSNPDRFRGDILDCFAGARNGDVETEALYVYRPLVRSNRSPPSVTAITSPSPAIVSRAT